MVKVSNFMYELLCVYFIKLSLGLDVCILWLNMLFSVEMNVVLKSDRKFLLSEWIGGEWLVIVWGLMRK